MQLPSSGEEINAEASSCPQQNRAPNLPPQAVGPKDQAGRDREIKRSPDGLPQQVSPPVLQRCRMLRRKCVAPIEKIRRRHPREQAHHARHQHRQLHLHAQRHHADVHCERDERANQIAPRLPQSFTHDPDSDVVRSNQRTRSSPLRAPAQSRLRLRRLRWQISIIEEFRSALHVPRPSLSRQQFPQRRDE